jgi:Asp/Glu/hydantoin racemase
VRILWQSFTDPAQHGAYTGRLQAYLAELAAPGVEYDIVGISPPDRLIHRLTELRCSIAVIRNALRAEEQGYDAFVIGHFQEPGLYDCRSALDIPVVGLGEASLLQACTLGRRIGLLTIDPLFIPWHEEQVLKHGFERRLGGVRAISTGPAEFMQAFEERGAYEEVRARFVEEALPLVEAGCDVLIPAGGLPALLFRDERPFEIDGALVVNAVAVAAKQAETAVALREQAGVQPSRKLLFAKPSPEAVAEFLAETA